jgi:hypothetical protein
MDRACGRHGMCGRGRLAAGVGAVEAAADDGMSAKPSGLIGSRLRRRRRERDARPQSPFRRRSESDTRPMRTQQCPAGLGTCRGLAKQTALPRSASSAVAQPAKAEAIPHHSLPNRLRWVSPRSTHRTR